MKKVLSLVLVLAMVLSSMSFAFGASTFEDVADTDYAKAIETLTALGVVTGYEDGTYRPEKTITRAEMAKLMVITLGYGDLVAGSKSNFTDTQGHWADPYIALAAGKGMVVGTGNGKFDPDRTVSYDEVYTMLVRGLGYTDNCNELKGMTWPTNFKVKAAELGITKSVAMSTTGADRGGVAQAIFNALEATLVSVDSDGNVVNIVDKNKNGLELLSRIADIDEDYVVSSELFDPTNKNYAGDMVDLAPYIYQSLKVYLNDDDEVVYIKDTNSLVIEGEVDEVTLSKSGKVATVAVETADGSIKKLDFTVDEADGLLAEIPGSIFENRASKSEATFKYLEDTESIKIVANEGTKSNGKIEEDEVDGFVLETQTKVARVEEVYGKGDDKVDVFTLPTNSKDEPDFNKIIVKGDADSLEDIKVDDVVVEYLAEDDEFTTLVVSRDTVEGEITRIGGTDVYVDGTKYKLNTTAGHEDSLLLGDEGIFFLDHNGKIVAFDGEGAGATDYAVVLDVASGEISGRFDNSLDEYPQLKVITQAGDEVVYDVYVKLNSDGNKVSDSAKYTGTDGKTSDLFVDADIDYPSVNKISSTKLEGLDVSGSDNTVIKMKLNSDKKITKIEVVEDKSIDLDTTKSSFKLATNALIFSIADQDSVSESKLNSTVVGTAVYNKNGQIEVLLTNSVDDANYTFAYITKIQDAKQNGDEVQALTAYVNGEKIDPLYTDDDDVVTGAKFNVYALDLGSDNIATEAKLASKVTTSQGLTAYKATKATGVSSGNGTIQLSGAGWLNLAEDATIVGVDEDGDVKAIRKLSSIVKNESIIDVYYYDSEVVLIVIHEDYEKETTPPVVENSKVTFVNEDEGLIEVDNKVLKLDSNVRLVSADGKDTLAIGPKSVASKLTKGDELAKVTQKDGAVVEIQLAK
jgi:S-layer family protein